MVVEFDVALGNGAVLHGYDSSDGHLAVMWHHGTPNIGAPPEPLFGLSQELGLRWISYDRPGYGGSSRLANRDIASAARFAAAIADDRGIDQFAVVGHSGGGPHALACAALLPDRVRAVVSAAGLAPLDATDPGWFTGMYPGGEAELRAAVAGPAELAAVLQSGDFDPEMFTQPDHRALTGDWNWLNSVVGPALQNGPGGMIDDDLAYVRSWGFDPTSIAVPALILHGAQDRIVPISHGERLAATIPSARAIWGPADGHLSVLQSIPNALRWISRL